MTKDIVILGSTGSIGSASLKLLNQNKQLKIKLLTANKNIKKIFKQALLNNVKNVIIEDKIEYDKFKNKFRSNNIKLHLGINNIDKILKKKITYCINAISGINGLEPTLKIIPLTKNILIANKESIICGWNIIKKKLKKNKTNFIPIDSEHFSIWNLIKNKKLSDINKIILTASGGPFLNKSISKIYNIKPKYALNHPNWKMGKKISIDSSTMMNKVFEFIEAKKIFNLKNKHLSILVHPSSFVHAIVFFNGGIIKFLAHDTNMIIPISNALGINLNSKKKNLKNYLLDLNNLEFFHPNINKFPLLKIINLLPERDSFFETILITLNDNLVDKYLMGKINYISIHLNILNLIEKPYFKKYYKLKPTSLYDIKKMIEITNNYLDKNYKYYEK